MGFLAGRASFLRFRFDGTAPRLFDQDQLDQLAAYKIGYQTVATADGVDSGWTAGGHVLDTEFALEKNIINDAMVFELRIDKDALPGETLRAYYEIELLALTKDNPSGKPSVKQKREAKETARTRIEQEAKDGRYKKRKTIPVLWHLGMGEVWFGVTAVTHVDRFVMLFEQTFGAKLDALPAGRQAYRLAEMGERSRAVDDASLSPFVPGLTPGDVAWIADGSVKDFLGNEFLLWLWWYAAVKSDTVTVTGGSEVTFMLANTLALDCPRGQTGSEAIKHESPPRLPEAKRAVQAGKLPRKTGITLVHKNDQYEFTLGAELLAINGAKLPPPDEDTDPRGALDDRVTRLRELSETVDLLYAAFLDRRLSPGWADGDLAEMQQWLARTKAPAAV